MRLVLTAVCLLLLSFGNGIVFSQKRIEPSIGQLAQVLLKRIPTIESEIGGYTYNTGGMPANRWISAMRAQSVHHYLSKASINAGR